MLNRGIKILLLSFFFTIAFVFGGCKKKQHTPNIVFILVDDLGYSDVEYMKNKTGLHTPNINNLVNKGMVFTNAYAAAPVCSPTRASLITGKSPAALKITCHIPGLRMEKYLAKLNKGKKLKEAFFLNHLPPKEVTIAEVLKEKGYRTGYIGKWHLGGDGSAFTENGIINSKFHPDQQGFDVNIAGCAYGQPKSYFSPYSNGTLKDGPNGEYLTDRLGNEAVNFIEKNKNRPFYLNFSTYTVHTPLHAPSEIVSKNKGNKYFAMIEKLDNNVGKIVSTLERLDLLENTFVVFYSDNGGLWGNEPLKGKKGTLQEGGLRVPLIISYPKFVEPSSTSDVPVTSVDFFPTLLELVGESPLNHQDLEGVSLMPVLKGEKEFKQRPLFWHFPHHRKEGLSMAAAVRLGKWKYIYEFETKKEHLYNLDIDISESENVVEKYPKKAIELSEMLKKWQLEVDAEFPRN